MRSNLASAPFTVSADADDTDASVTLSVSDANFEINFYAYDEKSQQRRKSAGVEVICPEASFPDNAIYPNSLCGEWQTKVLATSISPNVLQCIVPNTARKEV